MADRYDFEEFRLDVRERRLSRGDRVIRLEPRSFDLLQFLLEHAGNLVRKQEVIDAVWARTVVTDNALTRCMHQVRIALGDDASAPRFIETVPGAGYRFIAEVTRVDDQVRARPGGLRAKLAAARPWMIALFALGALGAAMLIAKYSGQEQTPQVRRLAVLPLENLTGDPDQEYFVEGVHDALVAALSQVASIDVISRTSVLQFRDTTLSVPAIARQLGVDAIVEGSVLRAGDNLSVTAQLIAAEPEQHLWANRYHRRVDELFEITTDITTAIAAEIAVELTSEERSLLGEPRSFDTGAYDDYLQARFHFGRRTPDGYRKAQELFQSAIDKDPNLASAYAGLAHSFGSAAIFGLIEPAAGMPRAKALAEKAIQIDPNLAEGLLILAGVAFYWDWDWANAERRIRRALGISPNSAHAYRLLAEVYAASDRHAEAFAAIERARDLDPLVATSQVKPALILYLARDYDRAIQRARDALEYFPQFWPAHWLLCASLSAAGSQEDAARACEAAVQNSGREPMALGTLGYVYALGGRDEAALEIAHELEAMMAERYVSRASVAIIHAGRGDLDRAFELLEEAYRYRDQMLVHDDNAAFLDLFRSDARFTQLMQSPPAP